MSARILYAQKGDLANAIHQLSVERRARKINILVVAEGKSPKALEPLRDEILDSNIYNIAVYLVSPEEVREMAKRLNDQEAFTLIVEKAPGEG